MTKKFLSERKITLIIQWWLSGAVYFYLGWGTQLGSFEYVYDLLFLLALVLFIVMRFLYTPVISMMFDLKQQRYRDKSTKQRVLENVFMFVANFAIIFLITYTYNIINYSVVTLFDLSANTVVLPGEPIVFGILYVLYYAIFEAILKKINSKGASNEKTINQ